MTLKNVHTTRTGLPVILGILVTMLVIFGCSKESDDIPTSAETITSLLNEGWAAYQQGEFETAIAHFENTIKRNVDPELSIDAYRGLGWTYARTEQYSQAITNFSFVISLETVLKKRRPVLNLEKVPAFAVVDTMNNRYNDLWQIRTNAWIVNLEGIESYTARVNKMLGPAPTFILAAGTRVFNLPKPEISNAAGTALGTELDNSLTFSPDSLRTPVSSPAQLQNFGDFYLDAQKGVVEIIPRINKLEKIAAVYMYHEKGYVIKRSENQFIALEDRLESLSNTPTDMPGDTYYLKGEFYNRYNAADPTTGGTYMQADAYAGMATAYLAQGDYASALKAARALAYINQDLKTLDNAHYPYKRELFENDNEFDMWDFYKIMALAFYQEKDYFGAEKVLEFYLKQGNVVDNNSSQFIFDLLTKINTLPEDAPTQNWPPVDLW
ncbi:MAG TPA: tetratricopeptide repeat protein [bacterium]|nr:tetratricopeptide repeat protein [bacterium]HPN45146.1 tetratricopeptide repeat protein [bacterium]